MDKNLFFIDAETDGLYGRCISVAIIVTDCKCNEIERFYFGIKKTNLNVTDEWTKNNVVPILGDYEECEDEADLLKRVWEVWEKHRDNSYSV